LGGKGREISEFEATLVYRVSFKTIMAIQRNPVQKKKKRIWNIMENTVDVYFWPPYAHIY
jgi:hypothetical protein